MPLGETIVALSTPVGESALAVIRLSGPACSSLCQAILQRESPTLPRTATVGDYYSQGGLVIDQGVFILFPDERSYTGEPMLEIHCHGNPLIVQKIIEDLVTRGCRLAQAGEFTRTAYLNDKMNLSQAEAVADLIHARSHLALNVAQRQLAGALGEKIQKTQDQLLTIIAAMEAYIDFPEDDLPSEDEAEPLRACRALIKDIDQLIATSRYRSLLHDGIRVVIVGAPNAGKSSLLNFLVAEDRAIVSPEPGTTRDFIEERIMIGPYCILITDTAGLHHATSDVEAKGIAKTMERVEVADFYLCVLDSTTPYPNLPSALAERLSERNTFVLINKIDLPDSKRCDDFLAGIPRRHISLKTGNGLQEIKNIMHDLCQSLIPTDQTLVVNVRHTTILSRVRQGLEAACESMTQGNNAELTASDLQRAMEALGEIVGRVDNEHMLDKLFATFCIGK